jgi:hypothetical protein
MANFPGSLDSLTNPSASDPQDSPSHSGQHATANDILEAVEAKVGTGASTPTAGTVLTGTGDGTSEWQEPSGGDPFNGGTITEPLTVDLAGQPAIAGLRVLDHNGTPIFGVSGAGITEPTLGGIPTLHADEHGVTVNLDGLSEGLVIVNRDGSSLFGLSSAGEFSITPPAGASGNPITVRNEANDYLLIVGQTYISMYAAVITMPNLPTSDPGSPGQLFTNGVPSAGTPKALMVSGG